MIEHILAWFLPIKQSTIAQILLRFVIYDKFSVYDNFENLNKTYKICSKGVTIIANFIALAVLIVSMLSLFDYELLSLPAKSALPFI